jgi:hypothetical protein
MRNVWDSQINGIAGITLILQGGFIVQEKVKASLSFNAILDQAFFS